MVEIVKRITPAVAEILAGKTSEPITLEFHQGQFQRGRHNRIL